MKRYVLSEVMRGFPDMVESSTGEWVAFKEAHADRRERIATACLAGLLSDSRNLHEISRIVGATAAKTAVAFADELIAALDRVPTK